MYLNSIRWRLTLSYAMIALLAAFALGVVLLGILRDFYRAQEQRYLQGRAIEIGAIVSQLLAADLPDAVIEDQARSWSFFLQARVRVEDAHGNLLADSGIPEGPQLAFIRSAVPFQVEIAETGVPSGPGGESFHVQILRNDTLPAGAVEGDVVIYSRDSVGVALPVDSTLYGLLEPGPGSSTRRSSQIVERGLHDADGQRVGRLILSDGPAYGDEILNNVTYGWIIAGIAAVLLAGLAGWLLSNRITTPLTELTEITSKMSGGDLSVRAGIHSSDEIGTLSRSFNEMAERVEEMVGTLRSFVADAAHEMHTPLTALQTNLELARDADDASAQASYLARAREQGQRLESLVSSMLDLSRLEAADARAGFSPLDFVLLIRGVGEQFASRAEQTQRDFQMRIDDENLMVLGDEDQLQQVVRNVLENALKFTPAGGSISVSLEAVGNVAVLHVTDTGIGIPPDDIPHLFERFHRGRNAAAYAGNGLGLAIVKAIVTAHGGSVAVESPGPRGTIVSISLPRHVGD